jgi:hypothetical protein
MTTCKQETKAGERKIVFLALFSFAVTIAAALRIISTHFQGLFHWIRILLPLAWTIRWTTYNAFYCWNATNWRVVRQNSEYSFKMHPWESYLIVFCSGLVYEWLCYVFFRSTTTRIFVFLTFDICGLGAAVVYGGVRFEPKIFDGRRELVEIPVFISSALFDLFAPYMGLKYVSAFLDGHEVLYTACYERLMHHKFESLVSTEDEGTATPISSHGSHETDGWHKLLRYALCYMQEHAYDARKFGVTSGGVQTVLQVDWDTVAEYPELRSWMLLEAVKFRDLDTVEDLLRHGATADGLLSGTQERSSRSQPIYYAQDLAR